jgi:hypothetical protein
MSNYPSYAAPIWSVGDVIMLGLTVQFPTKPAGIRALLNVLRERSQAIGLIGTPSTPTQHDVRAPSRRRRAAGRELLEEVGL